jgi:hypothetical protein
MTIVDMSKERVEEKIFEVFREETRSLTGAELFKQLDLPFSYRTFVRLLNELLEEGKIEKIGSTKGAKYKAVCRNEEAILPRVQPKGCFSSQSQIIIDQVTKPLFEREPVSYNRKWLMAYEPNVTFYIPENIRQKLSVLGKRETKQDPAGTYIHKIYHRLLIDLSYNSSRLEGNTYTLLETEKLLLEGDSPLGKLDAEKIMILNHKEAIRYLADQSPRSGISTNLVQTLHFLLSEGLIESKYVEKIRDIPIRIGGSTYTPCEDPKTLQSLFKVVIDKAAAIKNPFEQSLFLLIHLSYLQLFVDVNKRTARLAANFPLFANNYVPLAFSDITAEDYISAMIAVYELQEAAPIVDLYFFSYRRSCSTYDATVKAVGFDAVRVRYRRERRALLRTIIVEKMIPEEVHKFIHIESLEVPVEDRESFIEDLHEDLIFMNENRLAGLGITFQEFLDWKPLQSKIISSIKSTKRFPG